MISLFYNDNNEVYLTYYADIPERLHNKNYLKISELKEPEEKNGKIPILYANHEKYWYEYEDKPLTREEITEKKLESLVNSQSTIEDLLQEIILELYS